ncbi:MAG TPA: hypothetical protein VE963_04870, partial [Reyranella sp.]|nr:hypothetical protein [Reyranella sp.]
PIDRATVETASPPATRATAERFCASDKYRYLLVMQFLSTRNCPHFLVSLLGAGTRWTAPGE